MLDILDVDSRELDKQNTRLLSISVLITTVFFAHTMVSPYGRNLINICWLNKQMKDVFVTWSGKQYRSVVASWASEWQDEKCLKSLFWQWIFQVTLRNNYMALLMEPFLLEIAAWLSHILNISSFMLSNAKKIQHYKYYQLNQSDIYALWYLAELSQHLHYTSTVNQEGKALHSLHLAAKLYKINLFYIYIKVDIGVSVPVENGGPSKKKCLLLSFSHKIKWTKIKPRQNDKNNKS